MNKQNLIFRSALLLGIMVVLTQFAGAQSKEAAKGQFLNPNGLSKPSGFTQVVVAPPGKLVYVSGQTSVNANGDVVGKGDFRAQATQAMENLKTALAAAGSTMNDIIKANYYVVNLNQDQVAVIREVRAKYLSPDRPPASTLVGVTSLARNEYMIEIEVVAAVK